MHMDPWTELEQRLVQINALSMPLHIAKARARETLAAVRSGSGGRIERVEYTGPMTFLRAAGPKNRVYGGEWWFEDTLLSNIDHAFARVLPGEERKRATRKLLREVLALSATWNKMTEVWALQVPHGEKIVGYRSRAVPQTLFHDLPETAANKLLSGGAMQIFFPPGRNPLWVNRYGNLV